MAFKTTWFCRLPLRPTNPVFEPEGTVSEAPLDQGASGDAQGEIRNLYHDGCLAQTVAIGKHFVEFFRIKISPNLAVPS